MNKFTAGRHTVDVLYMDNHLLVVVKPVNMPTQPDSSGDMDLLSASKRYVGEMCDKPGAVYLGLVHRLDRPVGGVMVLARTSKAAARLSQAFAAQEVKKRYFAVVRGTVLEPLELSDYLCKNEYTGTVRVVPEDTPGAKLARLRSSPIATRDGLTLLDVELFTGRAHQIRVQHANAGYPTWGDARYGGGNPGEQIALWAHSLTFNHPTLKSELTFTKSPPPVGAWHAFSDLWEEQ